MKHRLLIAAALLALAPLSCSKCGTDSETAKKQAFEVKSRAGAQDREFDPKLFGVDPVVQERMIGMHFVEATRRLGDFSFRQTYQYDVHGPEKDVPLKGSDEIDQLKNGDFRIKSENDSGYGLEAVFVGGKYFVRTKGGSYHEHQNDRGDAGSSKQLAYAAGKSFWDLFEGKLAFADQGLTDFYGRIVHKYTVSFDPSMTSRVRKPAPKTPEPKAPETGADGGAASAAGGGAKAIPVGTTVPKSAKGFVLIDERAKAIVKTELNGELFTGAEGNIRITAEFKNELAPIKAGTVIKEPEIAPDPKRPRIEKDPLGKLEGKKNDGEKSGAAGKKDGDDDSEGGN